MERGRRLLKLGDAFKGRENNLALLRFVAAVLVIMNHAFVLTGNEMDFLTKATSGQTTLGQLAVLLFFFFGGFLIMKSMESKKTAKRYFQARCLRIFPALWIVILLSVFVLGPLLTSKTIGEYFSSAGTWKYMANCLLIPVHSLPGVFENNIAGSTVNGSLWTLPVEFICYILCFVFYKLRLHENKKPLIVFPLVAIGALAAWKVLEGNTVFQSAVLPILFFYIGMVCYLYRDRIPVNGYAALASTVILVASVPLGVYRFVVCLTYPYILLYIGFATKWKASNFGKNLEVSYAIYLTGFPVQQILMHFYPDMTPWYNFIIASCFSILISIPITMLDKTITSYSNNWLIQKHISEKQG